MRTTTLIALLLFCCTPAFAQNGPIPPIPLPKPPIPSPEKPADPQEPSVDELLEIIKLPAKPIAKSKVNQKDVDKWIGELSSRKYKTRENATTKLGEIATLIKDKLESTLKTAEDAEVRSRLESILSSISDETYYNTVIEHYHADKTRAAFKRLYNEKSTKAFPISLKTLLDLQDLEKKYNAESYKARRTPQHWFPALRMIRQCYQPGNAEHAKAINEQKGRADHFTIKNAFLRAHYITLNDGLGDITMTLPIGASVKDVINRTRLDPKKIWIFIRIHGQPPKRVNLDTCLQIGRTKLDISQWNSSKRVSGMTATYPPRS